MSTNFSSLLRKAVAQPLPRGYDDYCFESAMLDFNIRQEAQELNKGFGVLIALESLTDHFLEKNEVTPESLESYRVSVAAMFSVAGIEGVPESIVVPTFESGASPSEVKKKAGIFMRIIAWIKSFAKRMWERLKEFLGIVKLRFAKHQENLTNLSDEIGRIDVSAKPSARMDDYSIHLGKLGAADAFTLPTVLASYVNTVPLNTAKLLSAINDLKTVQVTKDTKATQLMEQVKSKLGRMEIFAGRKLAFQYGIGPFYPARSILRVGLEPFTPIVLKTAVGNCLKITEGLEKDIVKCWEAISDVNKSVGDSVDKYEKATAKLANWVVVANEDDPEFVEFDKISGEIDAVKGYKELASISGDFATVVKDLTSMANDFATESIKLLNRMAVCYKIKE